MQVLREFGENCRNVKFEIEDSGVYHRSCDPNKLHMLMEQFNKEVNGLDRDSQVTTVMPQCPNFEFLGLASSPYVTSTVSQSVRQTRFSYFPPLDFSDFLHQASLL